MLNGCCATKPALEAPFQRTCFSCRQPFWGEVSWINNKTSDQNCELKWARTQSGLHDYLAAYHAALKFMWLPVNILVPLFFLHPTWQARCCRSQLVKYRPFSTGGRKLNCLFTKNNIIKCVIDWPIVFPLWLVMWSIMNWYIYLWRHKTQRQRATSDFEQERLHARI